MARTVHRPSYLLHASDVGDGQVKLARVQRGTS
jgi:hypothetical protein